MPVQLPPARASEALLAGRAAIFKALGHPERLRLVERLRGGPVCVCELAGESPLGLPAVSKHLGQLRAAGVVVARRDGQKVYYELALPCLPEAFGCVDRVLVERAAAAAGLRAALEEPETVR